MDDWIKAGNIAGEALRYGKNLIKKELLLLEITERVEQKIYSLGGKPAFPVQLSLNNIAAHYNCVVNDSTQFGDDLVKLDVGVEYNGAIGDNAVTVDLSGKHEELVQASRDALNAALEIIKPGTQLRKVGGVIEEKITSFGFQPIKNLSGHGLGIFKIHDNPTVPNYDNGDARKLVENQTIAIEPFATDGDGMVTEGKKSEIYVMGHKKPIRNLMARKVLGFVEEEYKGLPFAKRWLIQKFPNINFSLNLLEREGIFYHYPQLVEKRNGLVSQAEHSIIVRENPIITTKVE